MDKDWLTNDEIGESTMPVSMLCDLKGIKKWIPIYYKGEKAGDILIQAKYIPPSITESLRLDDAKKLSVVSGTK